MESLRQQCQVDVEAESAPKNAHAKGLKVSPKEKARKYLEGGGTEYKSSTAGGRIRGCPKCTFAMFDKMPDYDKNKKENKAANTVWNGLRNHLDEYLANERRDPPVHPKTGKAITTKKQLGTPPMLPLGLHCHIVENFASLHVGAPLVSLARRRSSLLGNGEDEGGHY